MRRGVLVAGLALALALLSAPSRADKADKADKKRAEVPAAEASLHVTPGALGTPWTFEVTNADSTPLRIVADARLLTLDVTPGQDDEAHPTPKPTVHCSLPDELHPSTDADHVHVLAPGATYVETFDPRMYCWSGREIAALSPGARVVARLGWPGHGHSPPFVTDEVLGGASRAGVKELRAEPVVTPDELGDEGEEEDAPPARALSVSTAARIDAETSNSLEITVNVSNTTSRPVRLMLRPETLAFKVESPRGVHYCSWGRRPAFPIAEVFRVIPPHGVTSTTVLLGAICPDGAFSKAGLYTVSSRIDTRSYSARQIGLDSFDGVVRAAAPTLVRIRRSSATKL
jgi:hypothetical protein